MSVLFFDIKDCDKVTSMGNNMLLSYLQLILRWFHWCLSYLRLKEKKICWNLTLSQIYCCGCPDPSMPSHALAQDWLHCTDCTPFLCFFFLSCSFSHLENCLSFELSCCLSRVVLDGDFCLLMTCQQNKSKSNTAQMQINWQPFNKRRTNAELPPIRTKLLQHERGSL